jgi:hypothetical protein
MSYKFAHNETVYTPLIAKIVELTSCKTYLELGVSEGLNMHEITKHCDRCIGVDIVDGRKHKEGFEFILKTTDEFFKDFNEKVDIIFIDADHHFEQVKIDFTNSLNCLSEYGIIFLHDTDPIRPEFLHEMACGDSYKMHSWLEENYPELNVITLPITIAGLTMVNRKKDRRVLKFLK